MSNRISKVDFPRRGTFSNLLIRYIGERYDGDAPSVYNAARIDRRTYSSIISNPFRPVSKRTAIQFALALRLSRTEADELLLAAGFAFSPAIPEDVVFASFFDAGQFDLFKINAVLEEMGIRAVA